MTITNVELFPVHPPLAKRYRHVRARTGFESCVAAKVTTDMGITGYGDYDGPPGVVPTIESFDAIIETNPFDYIGPNLYSAVVMALYDIMEDIRAGRQ